MNKTVAFLLTVLLSSAAEAKDYVITDFGAVSDTTLLSTEAIQQAIDRCSEAGGGRVVVPADLPKIDEAMKDEEEREYPEATMWGNLPAKGFYVRHARHVSFQNVEVTTTLPDARPMYIRIDEN